MKCSCGRHTERLVAYFDKAVKLRATVCEDCANKNGFTNKEKYEAIELHNITEQQNKTPLPDAIDS